MPILTEQQLTAITEQFELGCCCYWHKITGELLFLPDLNNALLEPDLFKEELDKLKKNKRHFIEIERPTSHDRFKLMLRFTEQLSDTNQLKDKLINALNEKKPFSKFKAVIDHSGTYRQEWFDYKNAQLKLWVIDRFKV